MAARAEAVEPALAAIWAEVLDVEHVDLEDDFFELGGTSLLAMQIVARASDAFGVEVALDALFEAPTVAGLARQIDGAQPAAGRPARKQRHPFWKRRKAQPPALSDLQASAWAVQRFRPDARPHVGEAFVLDGPLDVPALERALSELVARHDILRTCFPAIDFRPQPRVLAAEPVRLDVVTVTRGSRKSAEAESSALVDAALGDAFDYEREPPLRIRLIRRGPQSHVLVLVAHEIVCDGWGFDALVRELSQLYNAFAAGRPSPLSEPALQYAEAIRLQQERRSERGRTHWERVLGELPLTLPLPFEAGGMPPGPGSPSRARGRIPARLAERLGQLAREEAATSFMLHLAAFLTVLHRYTGEQRLMVTSPAANRTRTELEGVIGFFARVLPLWADFGDDPSFRAVLRRTRESVLQSFAYAEDLPEDNRIAALNGIRGLVGCGAVFRLWDATLERRPELDGLRVKPFSESAGSGYLEMIVTERSGEETVTALASDSAGLDQAMIGGMLADYERVLEAVAEDADRRVSELDVRGATATGRGRRAAPAGGMEQDDRCLHELVEAQAGQAPEAVAVRGADGAQLTYGELVGRATALARALQARGVQPGARVGLQIAPSAALLVGMLGVLKTGGVCVPAEAHAVAGAPDQVLSAEDVAAASGGSQGAEGAAPTGPDAPALVIASAGMSRPPQAVTLSHRVLVLAARRRQHAHRLSPQDRMLQVPGAGALTWALAPWAILAAGGTAIAPGPSSPGATAWLGAQDATVAALPASLASSCLSGGGLERSSLRRLILQGRSASAPPASSPRARPSVVAEYAFAEAGGMVLAGTPGDARQPPVIGEEPAAGAGLELHILDPRGAAAPIGAAGELWLGGPAVAPRAHDAPDDEASLTLVPTGDLARRRPDGAIELVGRTGDEIRFRGFRLTPVIADLEAALRGHPAVAAAAALWDSERELLVACLVPRTARTPDPAQLDHWLQERMADWVLPRRYVVVESVPLRVDAAPDRPALLASARGAPSVGADVSGNAARANATSKQLLDICANVLGQRNLGTDDNFFAIGGSLARAAETAERATAHGIALAPQDLMLCPTVAELEMLASQAG
jgi:non-ribosomal peptide synthetase component F/acyl carrier protein